MIYIFIVFIVLIVMTWFLTNYSTSSVNTTSNTTTTPSTDTTKKWDILTKQGKCMVDVDPEHRKKWSVFTQFPDHCTYIVCRDSKGNVLDKKSCSGLYPTPMFGGCLDKSGDNGDYNPSCLGQSINGPLIVMRPNETACDTTSNSVVRTMTKNDGTCNTAVCTLDGKEVDRIKCGAFEKTIILDNIPQNLSYRINEI